MSSLTPCNRSVARLAVRSVAALVWVSLTVSACGGRAASDAASHAAADTSASPRILGVDDFGDTIPRAMPAARVVSLNPVTTELLFALGAGDRLVGRTHWDLYPAAAQQVTDIGDGMNPNVEAVLGQRPDLVLLYASESNRSAVAQLRAAGVATIAFRTDRIADLSRVVPVIATALGVEAQGTQVVDSVVASIARVRAEQADSAPRVTAFWHIWTNPLLTIGRTSYLSELLDAAGGANIFADLEAPSPQVTLEEIARRDPDVLLAGPVNAERIRNDPRWSAVRAVREGRVLVVDTTVVGRPGVRMGEAARSLRALLHPAAGR